MFPSFAVIEDEKGDLEVVSSSLIDFENGEDVNNFDYSTPNVAYHKKRPTKTDKKAMLQARYSAKVHLFSGRCLF